MHWKKMASAMTLSRLSSDRMSMPEPASPVRKEKSPIDTPVAGGAICWLTDTESTPLACVTMCVAASVRVVEAWKNTPTRYRPEGRCSVE